MNTATNEITPALWLGRGDSTQPVWSSPTVPPIAPGIASLVIDGFTWLCGLLWRPLPSRLDARIAADLVESDAGTQHEVSVQRRHRRLSREVSPSAPDRR